MSIKLLSWNVQGLGNPWMERALGLLLRREGPNIVFLMDTRLQGKAMDGLRRRVGYRLGFSVDSNGRSGGLACMWREELNVRLQSYSSRYIDLICDGEVDVCEPWRVTGVYGYPEGVRKKETWTLLRDLAKFSSEDWICYGDFNEILWQEEKEGGNSKEEWEMRGFRDAIQDCGLSDLGYEGYIFTWDNNRPDEGNIKERLDRVLVSANIRHKFPDIWVSHLVTNASDHVPILMNTEKKREQQRGNKPFRFESMWLRDPNCKRIIKQGSEAGLGGSGLFDRINLKLMAVQGELKIWDKSTFGHVQNMLREKIKTLAVCKKAARTVKGSEEEIELRKEIDELLAREEMMWKQRSRALWLREGDRNTKFFHTRANQRRKKNRIEKLLCENGVWTNGEDEIEKVVKEYFVDLFTIRTPDQGALERVLDSIKRKVTAEMNQELIRTFTAEEVAMALKQMGPLKAPGPDGFPALFYQRNWELVGGEVTAAVLGFLNEGKSRNLLILQKLYLSRK